MPNPYRMTTKQKTNEQLISELEQLKSDFQRYIDDYPEPQMWRKVIELSPFSIQILDKEGYTISVNKAFLDFFNTAPPSWHSLFNDTVLINQGLDEWFQKLKKGEAVFFPDTWYNPHDMDKSLPDIKIWVKTCGFPILDSGGKPKRFVVMHENITKRKMLEDALEEKNTQLSELTNYLHSINEKEKAKMAGDIHDIFGGSLSSIKRRMETVRNKINEKAALDDIDYILEMLNDTRSFVHKMVWEIRLDMVEEFGLIKAIESYASEFSKINQIGIKLSLNRKLIINKADSKTLYRIMQEALNNVAEHSNSKTAGIVLKRNRADIEFIIYDNGIGLPRKKTGTGKSYGVFSMKERTENMGGEFRITSSKNNGTQIKISLPFTKIMDK